MKAKSRAIALNALAMYGATLTDDNLIATNEGKVPTSIKMAEVLGRFRYIGQREGKSPLFIASSPITEENVGKFLESFWYWEQKFDVPCWLLLPDGRFIKGSDDNWAEDCKALYTETEHAARQMAKDMGLI